MASLLQRLRAWDTEIFLRLNQFVSQPFNFSLQLKTVKSTPMIQCVREISRTGDGYWYPLIGLLILALDTPRGLAIWSAALVAYPIELSVYWIVKNTIKRDRPAAHIHQFEALIKPSDQFSFPSGHTAAAFLFATLIWSVFPWIAPLFFIWASAIAASRVLLGVHYPSDLLAGACLGVVSAYIGILMTGMMRL